MKFIVSQPKPKKEEEKKIEYDDESSITGRSVKSQISVAYDEKARKPEDDEISLTFTGLHKARTDTESQDDDEKISITQLLRDKPNEMKELAKNM